MLLKDKVILVTGSTTGIGAAIAEACVKQGAKVMLHGRDKSRAQEMVDKLGKENARYALFDLSDPNTPKTLVEATIKEFGRVDSLVNNAGKSPRDDIGTMCGEAFDRLVRLNLRAPLFITRHVVRHLREVKRPGTIVNIGSINAYCGEAVLLGYSITKGGMMTMTRNLGNALASENIRVNQLNVGWTLTDNESRLKQRQGFPEEWETSIPETYRPSGRLLRPEEIARHVVFWASDFSAPANGVVYELEQYPLIGRNLINEIPLEIFKEDEKEGL